MAMVKFEVPHSLSREEAKRRVEALLSYWSRKYGMRAEWTGEAARISGKAMGIGLDAHLEVQDARVGGEVTDPGLLLRAQAHKYLTRKFTEYLDPGRSLEELERKA